MTAPAVVGGLRSDCGRHHPGERWLGALTAADRRALALVEGPVLDVGCGPARHTVALGERGIPALGIDITPALLTLARPRGAAVLERDVFGRIPGEGRWGSVLLLDGNVGIGGDVASLLARAAQLIHPSGMVLVELDVAPDLDHGRPQPRCVRVELAGAAVGPWFGWTCVTRASLAAVMHSVPLRLAAYWEDDGRGFATLRRRRTR